MSTTKKHFLCATLAIIALALIAGTIIPMSLLSKGENTTPATDEVLSDTNIELTDTDAPAFGAITNSENASISTSTDTSHPDVPSLEFDIEEYKEEKKEELLEFIENELQVELKPPATPRPIIYTAPGLYQFETKTMLMSWNELFAQGILRVTNSGAISVASGKESLLAGHLVLGDTIEVEDTEIKITSIKNRAFENCTKLQGIQICDNVTAIGDFAFTGCTTLRWVVFGDGVSTIGTSAFQACKLLTHVTLPDSLTELGSFAFAECTGLTYVNLGTNVSTIGVSAFKNCKNVATLAIPDSMVNLGREAFYGCSLLIEHENGVDYVGKWAVAASNTLVTATLRPDTVGVGEYAFNVCANLVSVTIPESVNIIGKYAFYKCTGLVEIYFNAVNAKQLRSYSMAFYDAGQNEEGITLYVGENVKTLTGGLFGDTSSHAAKLTEVVFAENSVCAGIGSHAFTNCVYLTGIEIPASITSLGDYAFKNCTRLTEIRFNATAMADLTNNSEVFYNAGRVGGGITVTVGANVERIPAYLFKGTIYYVPQITTVIFEEGSVCESIGKHAFYLCDQLESITLPASVTSIGDYAFCNCKNLESVTISENVTSIGDGAFCNNYALAGITFLGTTEQWDAISLGSNWDKDAGDYTLVCVADNI